MNSIHPWRYQWFSFALIIYSSMVRISFCPFTRKFFYSLLKIWQMDHRKVKFIRVQGKTYDPTFVIQHCVHIFITKDTFSWSRQLNYWCWHCVGHMSMMETNLFRLIIFTNGKRNVFLKSTMGVPTNMISSTEEKCRLVTFL